MIQYFLSYKSNDYNAIVINAIAFTLRRGFYLCNSQSERRNMLLSYMKTGRMLCADQSSHSIVFMKASIQFLTIEDISQTVIPFFDNLLNTQDSFELFENLTEMIVWCHDASFNMILTFLFEYASAKLCILLPLIKRLVKTESIKACKLLPIFDQLMQQFASSVNLEIQEKNKNVFDICEVLKCMSENTDFKIEKHDEIRIEKMRDLWIYLTTFIYLPLRGWSSQWLSILPHIATFTPALVMMKESRFLDIELMTHSCVIMSLSLVTLENARDALLFLFKQCAADIDLLSLPLCVYLLTLYQVEKLKVKHGNVLSTLILLADDRVSSLSNILESITSVILKTAINHCNNKQDSQSISEHLRILLEYSAHRLERVRIYVIRKINQILDTLPQFQWDTNLVYFIFDILNTESNTVFSEYVDDVEENAAFDAIRCLQTTWIQRLIKVSSIETINLITVRYLDLIITIDLQ